MSRKVRGLRKVEALDGPPCFAAKQRKPAGVLGLGVAYEAKVVGLAKSALPALPVVHGQWFRYWDCRKALGYAQADVLVGLSDRVVILEAKLSQCEEGDIQLSKLYGPIVEMWAGVPTIKVQVFKNAKFAPEGLLLRSIEEVVNIPLRLASRTHALHWMP